MDKSADFVQRCGSEGFHIEYVCVKEQPKSEQIVPSSCEKGI